MGKKTKEKVDGLSSEDLAKIRTALRRVWTWSTPRKICLKRALIEDDFSRCELCKKVVAKVYADHIVPCGSVDAGFINRLFCSSNGLQAICKACHSKITKAQRKTK